MNYPLYRLRQGSLECNLCRSFSFTIYSDYTEERILIMMVGHLREAHPLRYNELKDSIIDDNNIVKKVMESIEEAEANLADEVRKYNKEDVSDTNDNN